MKSMCRTDMFLDLTTMSAPSGEERTPRTSARVERAGLLYVPPPRRLHSQSAHRVREVHTAGGVPCIRCVHR